MAIYRNKTQQFTVVSQSIVRDDRLSLKDFGLLVRLLSLPDNWEFSENGLMAIFKNDGQASIRTGLKHLEEYGYLTRKRMRDETGRLAGVEWTIYDYPQLENPSLDNPKLENQPQYNTNQSTTNESTTKEKKESKKGAALKAFNTIIEEYTENTELREALQSFVQMRVASKGGQFTNRALELGLSKLDGMASADSTKIQIVNQSVMNGWKSFYEIKSTTAYGNSTSRPKKGAWDNLPGTEII